MNEKRWRLLATLLLLIALLWRMLGAPVTAEQWRALDTPLWQARALLPARMTRMLRLWPLAARPIAQPEPAPLLDPADEPDARASLTLTVYDPSTQATFEQSLESYVCHVVAAETPASYHLEALKAQAVAARTRVVAQAVALGGKGCVSHPGADICTDSAHCQGYATLEECRALWGDSYGAYSARIAEAVANTRGELITYGGEPITVLYHAMSGGHTEDARAVFAQSLPYLVGVESAGEETLRGCYEDAAFTYAEAAARLAALVPGATAADVRERFAIGAHTETGRVDTLQLAGQEIAATDLRRALGLRSTWFTLSADENGLIFHQRGYGHGVGMSQAGANAMAADGAGYADILAHYYQGTALMPLTLP